MANSKVVFEVIATSKGLKVVTKDIKQARSETDKLNNSQKNASKSAGNYDKQNKALYQTNLSSAKSFSKMNQTIGGSGGSGALVGSYAILAANVFAVTAAFTTFRNAAGVEKLAEGLTAFSNTTGQSLDLVSRRLQEATGNAVSFEQAMRTAALSTSAGFGTTEMEGLTKVAKGASLALGRDMGDALDRLTRGAIKLEPEILDELGIMVRLDDATESYAATLGKTGSQLTRFEKQQAFMNAIITEGEEKFGGIADSIDPNVYDQLAAAFADLAKNVLTVINFGLRPLIGFFLQAKSVFLGLVLVFAGSIAKRMVPAFGDMSISAKKAAAASAEAISSSIAMGTQVAADAQKAIKPLKNMPKFFHEIAPSIKNGTASTKEMSTAQGVLTREINKLGKSGTKEFANLSKANQKLVISMEKQHKQIGLIKSAQKGSAGLQSLEEAKARLKFADAELEIMEESDRQTFTMSGTMEKYKGILTKTRAAAKAYKIELMAANKATKSGNIFVRMYSMTLISLKAGFRSAAISAKVFGKALIGAIPIIGQIIMVLSLLWELVKFIAKSMGFFSEESAAAKEANKDLNKVLGDVGKKMEAIETAQASTNHHAQTMMKTYKIMGGLMKTVTEEALKAQEAMVTAGEFDPEDTVRKRNFTGFMGDNEDLMRRSSDMSPIIRALDDLEGKSSMTADFLKGELGMSFDDFIAAGVMSGKTIGEMTDESRRLLLMAEERFGGVSQSIEGMGGLFKESEKEANKFFTTITATTKFDGIQRNVTGLLTEMNGIVEQAEGAGMDTTKTLMSIAEAGVKMGGGMAAIIGKDTEKSFSALGKIDQDILTLTMKKRGANAADKVLLQAQIDEKKKLFKVEQLVLAQALKIELPLAKSRLANLIKQTIMLKEQQKFVKERAKNMSDIVKNEHTILAAKIATDAINQKGIDQMEAEKVIYEGLAAAAQAELDSGVALEDLSQKQKDALNRMAELNKDILISENEIAANSHVTLEARVAGLKTMKAQLALAKQLMEVEQKNLSARLELTSMTTTGQAASGEAKAGTILKQAQQNVEMARQEATIKMMIIEAEHALLAARITTEQAINSARILEINDATDKESMGLSAINSALTESQKISNSNMETQRKIIDQQVLGAVLGGEKAINSVFTNLPSLLTGTGGAQALADTMATVFAPSLTKQMLKSTQEAKAELQNKTGPLTEEDSIELKRLSKVETFLKENMPTAAQEAARSIGQIGMMIESTFGESGAVLSSFAFLSATITDSFEGIGEGFKAFGETAKEGTDEVTERYGKMGDALAGVGNIIGSIGQLASASGKERVAAVDSEIAAEKKRDGKSKESLAKIKALEKKKEMIERKNFERNKKIQMAQIAINTAAAVMKTMGDTGFFGTPLAMAVAAMGAMQLAMVAGTSFQGGGGSVEAGTPSTIEVGKRDNKVDVSQGASSGELAYLRGQTGIGSNANNFRSGAAGMKSYAAGGDVLVGERGPEVISPLAPMEVTPNDKIGGTSNINFSINAVDAAGVQELLQSQRGNIIGMIREAAHEHGEEFMEPVNVEAY